MPKNATILMVRHAEKPASDADPTLAVPGQERAQADVIYFQHYALGATPLKISYIFAAANSDASERPYLTIAPLAAALKLDIDAKHKDKDYQQVADDLLQNAKYDNAATLICWHHGEILALAAALGVNAAALPPSAHWPPGPWPAEVFGWVLQLVYDASGAIDPTQTCCLSQRLVYDDNGKEPGTPS
jgi:hypothetical protein